MNALFLALLLAQGPPPVPLTYSKALMQSQRSGVPVVTFVGVPKRDIPGALVVSVRELADGTKLAIVVSKDGRSGDWFPPNMTTKALRQAAGLDQPSALPFDPFASSNQRSTAQAGVDRRDVVDRSLRYHPSHNCPAIRKDGTRCPGSQYVVSGSGPNGSHIHTCPLCWQSWYH